MASREYTATRLYPSSLVISDALDRLIALALRDFVSSWYNNITKDPTFVNEVDRGVRSAMVEIRDRIFLADLVNLVVSRIVPILTGHLKEFDQAERVVRGRSLNRSVTESEELDLAIAAKYNNGNLHPAASLGYSDTKLLQQEHLRKILVRVLPDVLPENMIKSRVVLVLIKEIVACAVLFPLMQMVADPDTWNQIMVAYGRSALQDRKTVRRLRAALDEHAAPNPKVIKTEVFLRLAPHDSERAFERFVRAIRKTNSLSEARRFRSQVSSQLKRENMVENQDQLYLRRLETGKRVLDQKVVKLSAIDGTASLSLAQLRSRDGRQSAHDPSLVEVMHNSSGLSYFMEYMDRQKLMSLVQFWIVVDGLRNPLEDDFGEEASASSPASWTEIDRSDIAQISEAYLSKPELKVPEEGQSAVKDFLRAGRKATPPQYRQARTAILAAQSANLEEMENKHFPGFKKSDLYYKYLTMDEVSYQAAPKSSTRDLDQSPQIRPGRVPTEAPSMVRSNSQPAIKAKHLRRVAMSSNIRTSSSSTNLFDDKISARRSFDTERSAPLFDDEYDTDPLANSTYSLGGESQNGEAVDQRQIIESMEVALNNIITEAPKDDKDDSLEEAKDSLFGSPLSHKSSSLFDSSRGSIETPFVESVAGEKVKPSIASLGLVNPASRIGVFSDNDLFPDQEKFIEDEYADSDTPANEDVREEEIHEAAPGDLGLSEAISALTNDIERLVSQESVVDALTRKAELTNNVAELRILGKSKSSLRREIRRKELQRQQYIVQESDNSLYGRSAIHIKSVMVGREGDGSEYALYLVEVQRKAGEQMPAASWAVARRYSEFHDLHQRLRKRYPSTRSLDFPRRRMVMKLQKEFLHKRRVALEEYLRQLLLLPDLCRSRELRSFLSQQAIMPHSDSTARSDTKDIVTRIYNSVTDGMDDFLGNITVLDQLTVAGQNLITAATTQLNTTNSGMIPDNSPNSIAEAEAELSAFEERELEPFVKPICDIFLETFELNRGNNWLRGRAVVVVLHQLLGGTVERKVRETVKSFTHEDAVLRYIDIVKETMWPDDKMRDSKPRTSAEKTKSRREASVMLATLVPDLAANVVGRANAQAAARRIFATMNNERLNKHLAFTILDEIISILFGGESRKR